MKTPESPAKSGLLQLQLQNLREVGRTGLLDPNQPIAVPIVRWEEVKFALRIYEPRMFHLDRPVTPYKRKHQRPCAHGVYLDN
jgi:hypothetical protein